MPCFQASPKLENGPENGAMIPTFTGSAEATGVGTGTLRQACQVHNCFHGIPSPFGVRARCWRGYFVTTRTGNELSARKPLLSR